MAVLSVVATREGIATRHSALQDAAGDEVAAAFTPSTENAFDAAVQGATADDALATPAASEWTTDRAPRPDALRHFRRGRAGILRGHGARQSGRRCLAAQDAAAGRATQPAQERPRSARPTEKRNT